MPEPLTDRIDPTQRLADREAVSAAAVEGWTADGPLVLDRRRAGSLVAYRPTGLADGADEQPPIMADRLARIWLNWLITLYAGRPDLIELVGAAGDASQVTGDGWLALDTAEPWGDRFARWIDGRPWVKLRRLEYPSSHRWS